MHGIVSLLDIVHYTTTEQLWVELAQDFGLQGVFNTPYPHFSYHVAQGYVLAEIEAVLRRLARLTRPFVVTTAGLGVFTGPAPVLYFPIVRTLALSQFHQQVWSALEPLSAGSLSYYQPAAWLPHITLAACDLAPATLAEIMQRWAARTFTWEITINNLSYIADTGTAQVLRWRYDFAV